MKVLPHFCSAVLPRKALGMVILSHMRSLTSRPDSGEAIALATEAMSECRDRLKSSKPGRREEEINSVNPNFKLIWKTRRRLSRSVSVTEDEEVMVLREELPGKGG